MINDITIDEFSIDYLDKEISDQILEASRELLKNEGVNGLVWPAMKARGADHHIKNHKPSLVLVPLQRVGAPEGASGAKVLVAYFNNISPLWCSKPVILKYDVVKPGKTDKLEAEKEAYENIKPYVMEFEANFAAPIYISKHSNFRCLWSPFLSTIFNVEDRSKGILPKTNDLWQFLTTKVPVDILDFADFSEQLSTSFDAIYNYLRPLHDRFGMVAEQHVKLGEKYKRYLRDYIKWIASWERVWGKEMYLSSGNRINPIYVFTKLIEKDYVLRIGAVHGDLHPKNILLDHFNRPQIIDFGWSRDDGHVLMDFGLMEANLRFVTLHNPVPPADLELLSQLLTVRNLESVRMKDPYMDFIRKSIISLRHKARLLYANDDVFEKEYAIALFLISFGLLKHITSFQNQPAAQRTVETVAHHAYDLFLK